MTDTAISVAMLLLAYDGVGPPPDEDLPPWWLYQIVVSGLVIGDISLRPLPEPVEGRTAVEIGYNVVPNWQGFGVATAACRLMLDLAWSHGADEVCAEASPYAPASRRVLAKVGFEPYDEDWFVIFRPATVEVDHG